MSDSALPHLDELVICSALVLCELENCRGNVLVNATEAKVALSVRCHGNAACRSCGLQKESNEAPELRCNSRRNEKK